MEHEQEAPLNAPAWLLCPICSTLLSAPFSLPCAHTFCDSCVCRLVSDAYDLKTAAFDCPLCRASVAVDVSSPKQIAEMFSVDKTMQENVATYLSETKELLVDSSTTKAPKCGGKGCNFDAVKFCTNGCGFLCVGCEKQHRRLTSRNMHDVFDVPNDPENKATCIHHPTRSASVLCYSSDFSKFLCVECERQVKEYEGTKYSAKEGTKKLAGEVEGYVSDCEKKMSELEKRRLAMEAIVDKGEEKKEKLKEQVRTDIQELREKALQFIKNLDDLEVRLMEKLEEIHDDMWKPTKFETHELATSEQTIQHAREMAASSLIIFQEHSSPDGLSYSRNTQSAIGKGFRSIIQKYDESEKELEKTRVKLREPISKGIFDEVDIRVGKLVSNLRNMVTIDTHFGDESKILQVVKPGKGRVWGQKDISNYKSFKQSGAHGPQPLHFENASSFSVHPQTGNIYITDQGNHRIQVLSPDLELVACFGRHGSKDGEFQAPTGIAISDDGLIAISDYGNGGGNNGRVQIFDSQHAYLSVISFQSISKKKGHKSKKFDGFNGPCGLTFDSEGNLYVANFNKHRVDKFNRDFEYELSFANAGTAEKTVSKPVDTWVNSNGEICVHGYGEKAKYYNSVGKYLRDLNVAHFRGWSHGQEGLDGTLYLVDSENNKISGYSPDGRLLLELGGYGSTEIQFTNPLGVCFGLDGRMYVLECGSQRVHSFGA